MNPLPRLYFLVLRVHWKELAEDPYNDEPPADLVTVPPKVIKLWYDNATRIARSKPALSFVFVDIADGPHFALHALRAGNEATMQHLPSADAARIIREENMQWHRRPKLVMPVACQAPIL